MQLIEALQKLDLDLYGLVLPFYYFINNERVTIRLAVEHSPASFYFTRFGSPDGMEAAGFGSSQLKEHQPFFVQPFFSPLEN